MKSIAIIGDEVKYRNTIIGNDPGIIHRFHKVEEQESCGQSPPYA